MFATATTVLNTQRLLLRTFQIEDAGRLAHLAGVKAVSDTMLSLPYPYSVEQARATIGNFESDFASRVGFHFAIELRTNPIDFIGYMAIKDIDWEHEQAELSFWLDAGHRSKGYVTEAGAAVLELAFGEFSLNRVCAYHMRRNPASGRVLSRLGFVSEGCLRQRVKKQGQYEDACVWAKLRQEHSLGAESAL